MSSKKKEATKGPWRVRAIAIPIPSRSMAENQKRWDEFAEKYQETLNGLMKDTRGPLNSVVFDNGYVIAGYVPEEEATKTGGEASNPFGGGSVPSPASPSGSDAHPHSPQSIKLFLRMCANLFPIPGVSDPDDKHVAEVVREMTAKMDVEALNDVLRAAQFVKAQHEGHTDGCVLVEKIVRVEAAVKRIVSEQLS